MSDIEKPSPVSMPIKSKIWLIRFGAGSLAIIVLYLMFSSGSSKKIMSQEKEMDFSNPNNTNVPQLALTQKQVEKLQKALSTLHNETSEETMKQQSKVMQLRMAAPLEVYSGDDDKNNVRLGNNKNNNQMSDEGDVNSRFMTSVISAKAPTEYATSLAHRSTLIAQGTVISATLETAIASDLSGMTRAVISNDVYSDDGETLLIPRGSRLVGQYNNGIAQGQNRVFVIWQRVMRPDGIYVQLNSPGTDPLGGAGLPADGVDYHFWQQFGTASLLSVIGAGAANLGVNGSDRFNSSASYRSSIANSFLEASRNSLQNTGAIKPTLYKNQGDKINVMVARDLDFYDALKKQHMMQDEYH